MLAFVIVLQVLVALFLIMVVLLQPGNRGGASAALGGAGSDTVFGGRGANTFLSKITFGAAVAFMVTNLLLSYMSSSSSQRSVLDSLPASPKKEVQEQPAAGAEAQEVKPADGVKAEDGAGNIAPDAVKEEEAKPEGDAKEEEKDSE